MRNGTATPQSSGVDEKVTPRLKFYDLKTSTKTVMVYTNLSFNLGALLTDLPTCRVRLPANRKAKKTEIWGPYGGLITVQNGKVIRGVDIRKTKKAPLAKVDPGEFAPIPKSIDYFLNQISVFMSLTGTPDPNTPQLVKAVPVVTGRKTHYNIHMMWFNSSIKIAGCRSNDDALLAINVLFEWYVKPLHVAGASKGISYYTLQPGHTEPKFVFDTAMKNVDFSLGIDVNREKVNDLLNGVVPPPREVARFEANRSPLRDDHPASGTLPQAGDGVFMSQFETTEHKNVIMKMFAHKPAGFTWTQYSPLGANQVTETTELLHQESTEQLYTSFLIFFSGKVIMSGKYDEDMRRSFEGFVQLMNQYREVIEDRLPEITEEEKTEFLRLLG